MSARCGDMFDDSIERKGLSAASLKWVAVVTMLADHSAASLLDRHLMFTPDVGLGEALQQAALALHCIGRLAFPLFIFLLVEGFFHTHSRGRYLGRLVLFALISEFPFDLALFLWRSDIQANIWWRMEYQNVFFTLSIGFATMWAIERLRPKEQDLIPAAIRILACIAAVAAACLLAHGIRSDYSWGGVLAIVMGYLARLCGLRRLEIIAILVPLVFLSPYELVALLDYPLCAFYDGRKGEMVGKWFFYLFYPGHLLILGILRALFVLPPA